MRELGRDGYAVVRRFFAPEELAGLRAAVDRTLAEPSAPGCERPHNTLAPLRWDDDVVRRALASPARVDALRAVSGARDLRWISAYVSVKDGPSPPLWWHQDWWCWDHPVTYRPSPPQIAVLCYLADTSPTSGALRVLPGTHRRSIGLHRLLPEAHGDDAAALDDRHPALSNQPGQRTPALAAGDAAVLDYRLLHGTHANESAHRRDCLILTFVPDWAGLPDEVRAHLIRHPALPRPDETPASLDGLLPDYNGTPRDLPLSRDAPATFAMGARAAG